MSGGSDKTTELQGHTQSIKSVCFSPDGKLIASGSIDQTVRCWDAATGQQLGEPCSIAVNDLCFSRDNKTFFLASNELLQASATTGDPLMAFEGHSSDINCVCLSSDGKILVSGGEDGTVRTWDVVTGQQLGCFGENGADVNSVAMSPDDRIIASGGRKKLISMWDPMSGKKLSTLKGHTDRVWTLSFSCDGMTLASGSWDKTIRMWDVCCAEEIAVLDRESRADFVSFSPTEHRYLSAPFGSKTISVQDWDEVTGRLPGVLGALNRREVFSVCMSHDGKIVASGTERGAALYNAENGQELGVLQGHTASVGCMCFSADSKMLVSGSFDATARLWDVAACKEIHALCGHTKHVASVAISIDNKVIASGSEDGSMRLWDAASGQNLHVLGGHTDLIRDLRFSRDSQLLVSASYVNVLVWNVGKGKATGFSTRA